MRIGVSGHRRREGADWAFVRERMEAAIAGVSALSGYTSLAPGADQIFADLILAAGLTLVAVVPIYRGKIELEEGAKADFDRFCEKAHRVIRVTGATRDGAFFKAGKRVVDEADRMVFVWDGLPSRGLGGTADIVAYARKRRKPGVIVDPVRRLIGDL